MMGFVMCYVDSNSFVWSLLLLLLFTFRVVVVVGYSVWLVGIFRNGCCIVVLVVFAPMLNARVVRYPCCFWGVFSCWCTSGTHHAYDFLMGCFCWLRLCCYCCRGHGCCLSYIVTIVGCNTPGQGWQWPSPSGFFEPGLRQRLTWERLIISTQKPLRRCLEPDGTRLHSHT